MKVRLAHSGDIGAICMLYQKFYEYNAKQQPDYYRFVEESGKYPESVINGNGGDLYVAETADGIIGFIHVEEERTEPYPPVVPHKYAYIVDLYVEPEHRRGGVGKALLESVKGWAKDRGLEYLELLVLDENLIGRSFYERENFKPASHKMRYAL
jgi:GNAT superfamily N-acetyltransferase